MRRSRRGPVRAAASRQRVTLGSVTTAYLIAPRHQKKANVTVPPKRRHVPVLGLIAVGLMVVSVFLPWGSGDGWSASLPDIVKDPTNALPPCASTPLVAAADVGRGWDDSTSLPPQVYFPFVIAGMAVLGLSGSGIREDLLRAVPGVAGVAFAVGAHSWLSHANGLVDLTQLLGSGFWGFAVGSGMLCVSGAAERTLR